MSDDFLNVSTPKQKAVSLLWEAHQKLGYEKPPMKNDVLALKMAQFTIDKIISEIESYIDYTSGDTYATNSIWVYYISVKRELESIVI